MSWNKSIGPVLYLEDKANFKCFIHKEETVLTAAEAFVHFTFFYYDVTMSMFDIIIDRIFILLPISEFNVKL